MKALSQADFDPRPYVYVLVAVLLLSVLRGIRFPNIWSYSHFLFNYEFGFVKRGLIGGIISPLESPFLRSYELFFFFSLAVFVANIVLLCLLLRDLLKSKSLLILGCSLVFVSSLAVVFLSHTIGYSDHIGLLITLITLRINEFPKKLLFILPALTIALLIHEATLILFYPVIFISLWLCIEKEKRRRRMALLSISSMLFVALSLFVSNSSLDPEDAQNMHSDLQSEIGSPLRKDAFDVLHRDAAGSRRIMRIKWSKDMHAVRLGESLMVTLPAGLLFVYVSFVLLRSSNARGRVIVLSTCAALSPLLLHFIAWDMHRWNSLAVTTSFLMLYMVYQFTGTRRSIPIPRMTFPVIVLVVVLNGMSHIGLFDNYYVKQFPFVEHQQYIMDLHSGQETFPSIPDR